MRIETVCDATRRASEVRHRLRELLGGCSAVEGIVILQLIERADALHRDVGALASAIQHDADTPD